MRGIYDFYDTRFKVRGVVIRKYFISPLIHLLLLCIFLSPVVGKSFENAEAVRVRRRVRAAG